MSNTITAERIAELLVHYRLTEVSVGFQRVVLQFYPDACIEIWAHEVRVPCVSVVRAFLDNELWGGSYERGGSVTKVELTGEKIQIHFLRNHKIVLFKSRLAPRSYKISIADYHFIV